MSEFWDPDEEGGIWDYPEPPADRRKAVGTCIYCGEEIYAGDDVYHDRDDYCHKECVQNMAPDELLELAGLSVREAAEKLGITYEEAE